MSVRERGAAPPAREAASQLRAASLQGRSVQVANKKIILPLSFILFGLSIWAPDENYLADFVRNPVP